MDKPDMLITNDTQVLQQILSAVAKTGDSKIAICLISVNQLNICQDGHTLQGLIASQPKKMIPQRVQRQLPDAYTKEMLAAALNDAGWSRLRAAEKLGISRMKLNRLIAKFGLLPPSGLWPSRGRGRRSG